jgi:hypothetical protein
MDTPRHEQPFRYIAARLVVLAPTPQLRRTDASLFRESQPTNFNFELTGGSSEAESDPDDQPERQQQQATEQVSVHLEVEMPCGESHFGDWLLLQALWRARAENTFHGRLLLNRLTLARFRGSCSVCHEILGADCNFVPPIVRVDTRAVALPLDRIQLCIGAVSTEVCACHMVDLPHCSPALRRLTPWQRKNSVARSIAISRRPTERQTG